MIKTKEDLVIHKPNQLIEIEGGSLTTNNLLAYNYILHKLQKYGKNNIIISGSDFFRDLELSKHYDELISYLDSLRKISVVSRDKKGKLWGAFNLLSAFKRMDDKTFYVEIPNLIYEALCKKEELYYTTIKLLEQKAFKSFYTIIFYEIFKKYEKINIPEFTIEELKKLTGTEEKYKEYKYFKRDVLEKSVNELNLLNNKYEYEYLEERLGRKIYKIKFIRHTKIGSQDDYEISPTLNNAIIKAKKSRYIEDSYSQKAMIKLISQFDEKYIIKALKEAATYNRTIKNFSAFMTSKISDIIKSSKITELTKSEKVPSDSQVMNTDKIPSVEIININNSVNKIIEITQKEYDTLYQIYLKENEMIDLKPAKIAFRQMTLNKYKIKTTPE
ncbi:replication initiation protein [uncultured Cetobacterium sp.]|uniref:replication initiation protein n=1 Tax=uncultured Cetobacterium sp. TaxID=527638 RepID=UPI002635B941|nr:RepB family plasmid replication initiator protein [uncultured Cetobacterium sp.]